MEWLSLAYRGIVVDKTGQMQQAWPSILNLGNDIHRPYVFHTSINYKVYTNHPMLARPSLPMYALGVS